MTRFKEGDLVYCPSLGNQVYKLRGTINMSTLQVDKSYPIGILIECNHTPFQEDGRGSPKHAKPSLFHATEQNHAKLEAFWGESFELPPAKPTSFEIIKSLLESGEKYVLCLVTDLSDEYQKGIGSAQVIVKVDISETRPFINDKGESWLYAIPINTRGNLIEKTTA